jgi:hypothetical protein
VSTTLTSEMAAALAQAEAVLEHGVDGAGQSLSGLARSVAADTVLWLSTAPLDQSRKQAQFYGGVGPTKELQLENVGIFEAFADGVRVRVSSRSIARRRIALAILSHPAVGPRLKIRQPKARFQKRPRPRTPAELEGLRRGNEQRAEKAQLRRATEAARG